MKHDQTFAEIYPEIKAMAHARMSGERESHTLCPTAVAHEAMIKVASRDGSYQDRNHLKRVIARAIEQILIDYARTKGRQKRGGAFKRLAMDQVDLATPDGRTYECDDLITLAEALEALEQDDPQLAEIVQLRVFRGLRMIEIAEVLGVSERTVYNDWSMACAKLRELMGE